MTLATQDFKLENKKSDWPLFNNRGPWYLAKGHYLSAINYGGNYY